MFRRDPVISPGKNWSLSALLLPAMLLMLSHADAANKFWDASAGLNNGVGGSATWTNQGDLRWSNTSTGDAALSAAAATDDGIFQGTAGTVTVGGDLTLNSWTFNVTNYVLTPSSATLRTLTGAFSLAASVNLNIGLATKVTDSTFSLVGSGITGGAGSGITLQGQQVTADGRAVRIQLSQANASIDVPITISGTGTTAAGILANAAGTGVTGTITNNSGFTTLLGATAGDLTLSSTAVISGSAGLRIGVDATTGDNVGTVTINSANTYGGGTTLDGGTLVIGNNTALSGGTLTLSNSSTSVLQAGGGARTLANNIVWGGNGTISGSNAFTFNGTFTSSGAVGRSLTVSNTGGLAIAGNVFLAATDVAGGLTINGASAVSISSVITNNSAANTVASAFTYSGTNTLTLSNANTYTGATTIGTSAGVLSTINANANGALGSGTTGTASIRVHSGGTLILSNSSATDRVRNDAPITLGTASGASTATIQRADGGSEGSGSAVGLGALTLAAGSSLNYGGSAVANGTLTFASFTPAGFTLSISGYDGVFGTTTPGVDGTNDRLIFNTDQSANLARFSFINPDGLTGTFAADEINLGNGFFEIVPVPEPTTWAASLLTAAALGYTQRRRFAKRLRVIS